MVWQAPNLRTEKHCFFGSEGGISVGIYAGLNVNTRSLDKKENLNENLSRAAQHVGLMRENLLLLCQGVSADAFYVDASSQDVLVADGAVTDCPNIGLCIRTADCAPVLLEDRVNGVVGAAHAGWRGAFKGIIENVVALMVERGADVEHIAAAVGPCIAQDSYEVDANFYRQFIDVNSGFAKYFMSGVKQDFYQFDLKSFCVDKLKSCGVQNISCSADDTYALADKYYSFRRFTHQNLVQKPKDFATELSVITL
jgi:hypothetical protein